jgi:ABC-type dipeptide/oligopeptide/nickel transport system permease component
VILAWMVVAALFVVIANLVADILYGALDPRIRVGSHRRGRVRVRAGSHE